MKMKRMRWKIKLLNLFDKIEKLDVQEYLPSFLF